VVEVEGGGFDGIDEIIGVFAPAAVEPVTFAGLGDEVAEVLSVRPGGEVGVVEAAVVVGDEVREVLPNEAQVGRTGARLEEEWVRGKEAGVGFCGASGHAIDGLFGIGDSGE
jgi:hypothetical protein